MARKTGKTAATAKRQPTRRKPVRKESGRSWLRLLLLGLIGLVGIGLGGVALWLALASASYGAEIQERFDGQRWSLPSRIYSDVTLLYPGQQLRPQQVVERLTALGYQGRGKPPDQPGEFRLRGPRLDLHLRASGLPFLERAATQVRLQFKGERLQEIIEDGKPVALLELEPEELMQVFGAERESRELVAYKQLPQHLVWAVLAAEDADFFEHGGVDFTGLLRAAWVNLWAGGVRQGGSTITQQLAKNYFLTPERTLSRKLKELVIARAIEQLYDKETILEIYLNEIYLGQRGSVSINGVGQAARYYFDRPVAELRVDQSALLAGLIRSPRKYSPHQHLEAATGRRNDVLAAMHARGWLDDDGLKAVEKKLVSVREATVYQRRAPYFFDHVAEQLESLYPREAMRTQGLAIFTTLDAQVQRAAERALNEGLERLEKRRPTLRRDDPAKALQGAVVVMQPRTGNILALAGGRNYHHSQFNRATHARRQPGSTFKPFVVLAGLDQFTAATLLSNERVPIDVDGKRWRPRNYDGTEGGEIRLRVAMAKSLNLPMVSLAQRIGLERVASTAQRFGFERPFKPVPSLALGAVEVTPLELARAYCAFAAEGALPFPLSVRQVLDAQGASIERRHVAIQRVATAGEAYLMSSLLYSVTTDGTAASISSLGVDFPVAGKTGTTNDYRDAWFVGYTPKLLVLVWVGFDDGSPIKASGSSAALPIFAALVKQIRWQIGGDWYRQPDDVETAVICAESGQLASNRCPEPLTELFLAGRVPEELCPLHGVGALARPLSEAIDKIRNAFGL